MDFLSQNQMYIVMFVILAIWLGIYWYLIRLDRRISALEHKSKRKEGAEG